MPQLTMDEGRIGKAVEAAIEAEVNLIIEQLLADAMQRLATEIRKRVGKIAISTLTNYSMQRDGSDLLIRVRME